MFGFGTEEYIKNTVSFTINWIHLEDCYIVFIGKNYPIDLTQAKHVGQQQVRIDVESITVHVITKH